MTESSQRTWAVVAIVCACIIGAGLYFGLRGSDDASNSPSMSPGGNGESGGGSGPTVYVTRTGECYHSGSCRYLSRSKIPMALSRAKARYRPCSRCSPPR